MIGFDSEKSGGDFKGTISSFLNRFPNVQSNDSSRVFIVNDDIYVYEGTIRSFLDDRNFFDSTKGIGDASFTDFSRIFEMILKDTRKYQVSALITDMIYSLKDQANVSASKILNDAFSITQSNFKGHISTSVIVLKFEADYNGDYYTYNSPSVGKPYSGNRPFYVMLFTSSDGLKELYSAPEYKSFINFSSLKGYENMFCFTRDRFSPAYSIVPKYSHEGTFRKMKKDRGADSRIVAIEDVGLSKDGKVTIPVALDLSSLPFSKSYKGNVSMYSIESTSGFRIEEIKSIDELDNDSEILKQLPGATHLMLISTDKRPDNETLHIRLGYKMPSLDREILKR